MRSQAPISMAAVLLLAATNHVSAQTAPTTRCADLVNQELPNTKITAAEEVRDGAFTPPGSTNRIADDLREFRKRGGKLLQYHGWNDQLIAPQSSIDYYESVLSFFGSGRQDRQQTLREVGGFYRLFMAPGMAHCGGGTGPNTFDMQAALEQWVERGIAPERVVATRSINGVVDRSRPLCPYPQVAVYKGQGDTNNAANFVCRE